MSAPGAAGATYSGAGVSTTIAADIIGSDACKVAGGVGGFAGTVVLVTIGFAISTNAKGRDCVGVTM